MPFRCKCGRTFEKPDTFSSHTSSCAPFHHRRQSLSASPPSSPPSSSSSTVSPLDMTKVRRFSIRSYYQGPSSPSSTATSPIASNLESSSSSPSPTMDYPTFMPTALSIQNAFEGVRRRSMSYGASLK